GQLAPACQPAAVRSYNTTVDRGEFIPWPVTTTAWRASEGISARVLGPRPDSCSGAASADISDVGEVSGLTVEVSGPAVAEPEGWPGDAMAPPPHPVRNREATSRAAPGLFMIT